MRLFLNASFYLKQNYHDILSAAMRILEANHWTNERVLFHFHDINDAKAEAQTVHAKICKAFPHFAPYWKSDYEETIKYHKDPIEPYQVSFFTNFPGWQQGKVMFASEDERITNQSVLQICEKIPRPYSLYTAAVILDGIDWYGEKAHSPAWDWRENEKEYPPGTLNYFYWDSLFYQSNSIALHKEFWSSKTTLYLRLELTAEHGKEEADRIVEIFSKSLGQPEKKYVYAVPTYEEKEAYEERVARISTLYEKWYRGVAGELAKFNDAVYATDSETMRKIPGGKTLRKQFLERNGLRRHDLCRWDDHGWCRQLSHNVWLYIEMGDAEEKEVMRFFVTCYGITFNLIARVSFFFPQDMPEDVARLTAYRKFEFFLQRFMKELAPKLADVYMDDTENFYQESISEGYNLHWRIDMICLEETT